MRLLVVGGTRGLGREVVLQGSARGHDLTLLARSGAHAPTVPRLSLVEGDARDPEALRAAVGEQDAVIVCLGQPPSRAPVRLFSEAVGGLLGAMRAARVPRLIFVSGVGAGDSRGHGGFWHDNVRLRLWLREVWADKERAEALVAGSPTRWTICRPGFLTNGPQLARYRIVTRLDAMPRFRAASIARADVAHFLLDEAERDEFVGRTPLVCY